jgi:hypothetical protein
VGRRVRDRLGAAVRGLRCSWPALNWAYQDWRRYGRVSTPVGLRCPRVLFVPIVGMHRSGTSCVTGILQQNGLHLSDDLAEPNPFNPEGFWESREVIRINEMALSRFNYQYEDPEGIVSRFPLPILRRAERYLLHLADRPVVGWKDPRTTITWPAWHELLYKAPHLVVACFRNPQSTANSFVASEARDSRVSYETALECWRKYNAVVAAIPSRSVLINFDEPLEPQIRYACRRIGLEFRAESMSVYKPRLVHNHPRDLSSGSEEADSLYRHLVVRWRNQWVGSTVDRMEVTASRV